MRVRLDGESGFSLIELLIAMLLLSVAIIGTAATLDSSRKVTNTADRQLAAVQVAEQAMEQIRSLPYSALAVTGTGPLTRPGTCGATPNNPDCKLNTGGTTYTPDSAVVPAENLIFSTTGRVAHGGSTDATNGQWRDDRDRLRGYIYRYVTAVNDSCPVGATEYCTATTDFKRLTVALWIAGNLAPRKPIIITSFKADPNAISGSLPNPNPCVTTGVDCK